MVQASKTAGHVAATLEPEKLLPYVYERLKPGKFIRLLHLDNSEDPEGPLTGTLNEVDLKNRPDYAALSYVWGKPSPPKTVPSSSDDTTRHPPEPGSSDDTIQQPPEPDSSDDTTPHPPEPGLPGGTTPQSPKPEATEDLVQPPTIECKGGHIGITPNCRDALTDLRRLYGNITVWVDSICINQKDEGEKGLQIDLMQDIYARARVVYVWLGPDSDASKRASKRAIEALSEASRLVPALPGIPWLTGSLLRTLPGHSLRTLMSMVLVDLRLVLLFVTARHRVRIRQLYRNLNVEDLESLLKRVWVERAWTFQEIVLSSNSTIVCGGKALPWDRLHRGLRFLLEYEHGGYSEAGERSWRNSATITAWMNLLNIWLSTLRQSDWTFADSEQNDEPGSSTKTRMGPRRSVQIYWESFFSEIGLLIGSKFLDVLFLLVPGVVFFSVGFAVWPVSDGEVTPQLLAFGLVGTAFVMGGALFVRLVYCRGGLLFEIDGPKRGGTITPRVGIVQALRERDASQPKDKAFALHGVLQRLDDSPPPSSPRPAVAAAAIPEGGPTEPKADTAIPETRIRDLKAMYGESLGLAYWRLFTALVRLRPPFVNLIVDAPMDRTESDTPTWVPNWKDVGGRSWLPAIYVYDPIDGNTVPEKEPSWDATGRELTIQGAVKDTIRSCFSWPTKFSRESSGEDSPEAYPKSLLPVLGDLHQWLQHSIKYARSYDPLSTAVSCTLLGSEATSDNGGTGGFDEWYGIMTSRSPNSDAIDQSAILESLRGRPAALAFAIKCVNELVGKRGVFFTEGGRIGSGPTEMAEGDKILLLEGVAPPMVLHESGVADSKKNTEGAAPPTVVHESGVADPKENVKYTVVGPAFMTGFMDWKIGRSKSNLKDIILI